MLISVLQTLAIAKYYEFEKVGEVYICTLSVFAGPITLWNLRRTTFIDAKLYTCSFASYQLLSTVE